MADSKLQNPDENSDDELVHCGICFAVIDMPKALPCLHTFCQKCLTKWSDSSAKKQPDKYTDVVSCPSCREEFPLPEGGVKNLRSNFFVTKMKERKNIQRKLQSIDAVIPCSSCTGRTSTPGVAVARCVECNDFLCDKCVEVHKSVRVLEKHQLLTLDELRSGKLAIHNLPEQETCPKHKGEVLRFYCETCDELMCRDCSVVDHPRPDHKQLDLESTAKDRVENLVKLSQQCEPVAKMITDAIETDKQMKRDLDAAFENAMASITRTTDSAIASVVEALKRKGKAKEDELQRLKARRDKEIECHLDHLNLMKVRVQTAMDMSHHVTEKGSAHDVATMYSSLSTNMKQACSDQPLPIRKSLATVSFTPNEDLVTNMADREELGVVSGRDRWSLEATLSCLATTPRGVTFNSNGDVVITDHYKYAHIVEVYDYKVGGLKLSINTKRSSRSKPWSVAMGDNGRYFVTDLSADVKVFDAQGTYQYRFGSMHLQDEEWLYNQTTQLYGLAIGRNGQVYVGSGDRYIGIHNQDGTHISSFQTASVPYAIAVSHAGEIFASDHRSQVNVYDEAGNRLRQFEKPPGKEKWYPTGLCCSSGNEVYVVGNLPSAILLYSTSGQYLDDVANDLVEPWDVALSEDGETLAVVDKQDVKIFHLE